MKYVITSVAAVSVLSACFGAPPNEKILDGFCVELFEDDARTAGIIAQEAKSDLAEFCSCYAQTAIKDTATLALHKDILVEMTTVKGDNALSVEQTADLIEDRIEAGEIDTFTASDFEDLGDYFQDLSQDMGEAGGTCPAS